MTSDSAFAFVESPNFAQDPFDPFHIYDPFCDGDVNCDGASLGSTSIFSQERRTPSHRDKPEDARNTKYSTLDGFHVWDDENTKTYIDQYALNNVTNKERRSGPPRLVQDFIDEGELRRAPPSEYVTQQIPHPLSGKNVNKGRIRSRSCDRSGYHYDDSERTRSTAGNTSDRLDSFLKDRPFSSSRDIYSAPSIKISPVNHHPSRKKEKRRHTRSTSWSGMQDLPEVLHIARKGKRHTRKLSLSSSSSLTESFDGISAFELKQQHLLASSLQVSLLEEKLRYVQGLKKQNEENAAKQKCAQVEEYSKDKVVEKHIQYESNTDSGMTETNEGTVWDEMKESETVMKVKVLELDIPTEGVSLVTYKIQQDNKVISSGLKGNYEKTSVPAEYEKWRKYRGKEQGMSPKLSSTDSESSTETKTTEPIEPTSTRNGSEDLSQHVNQHPSDNIIPQNTKSSLSKTQHKHVSSTKMVHSTQSTTPVTLHSPKPPSTNHGHNRTRSYTAPSPDVKKVSTSIRTDQVYHHAQQAGILWQTLVGEFVKFPSSWWDGARVPRMNLPPNTTASWKYTCRSRIFDNPTLNSIVRKSTSRGRILIHVVIKDAITTGSSVCDIAIGCFHPNAKGLKGKGQSEDENVHEDARDVWMAVRERWVGRTYSSHLSYTDQWLMNSQIRQVPTLSPIGAKRNVNNLNIRSIYGDEPPLNTIFIRGQDLYERIKPSSFDPLMELLHEFLIEEESDI